MTSTDHEATPSSDDVMSALEDAKAAFQRGRERLYEAFRVAVFDVLASSPTTPGAARVSRVLVTYNTMLGDVDGDLHDDNGELVTITMPELDELLRQAHGYLNFSTYMADFHSH